VDPVRRCLLAAGLFLAMLLVLLFPASAQQPERRVQATRQPHMFYEPQAKYPPLGAMRAFREGLPTALGAALASLLLAMWLTRPVPEMERALHQRQLKASTAAPSAPGSRAAPPAASSSDFEASPGTSEPLEAVEEGPALPIPEEGPAGPAQPAESETATQEAPPASEASLPEPGSSTREAPPASEACLPEPLLEGPRLPQVGPTRVPIDPASPVVGTLGALQAPGRTRKPDSTRHALRESVCPSKRTRPPLDNPLLAFSWNQVAPEHLLPFREGESSNPGLLVYLVEPDRVGGFLAALACELLLESTGSLILATVSAGPLEVVQALLEAEPTTPPAELLVRLRREGRAVEKVVRRLYVPRPGGVSLEDLLRRARDLREGRGGLAGVLLEPISRLEVGGGDLPSWLRRLHEGAALGGFPVFMVASRAGFPVGSCPGRVLTLGESEVARIIGRAAAGEESRRATPLS
jgi:hypothetical protein